MQHYFNSCNGFKVFSLTQHRLFLSARQYRACVFKASRPRKADIIDSLWALESPTLSNFVHFRFNTTLVLSHKAASLQTNLLDSGMLWHIPNRYCFTYELRKVTGFLIDVRWTEVRWLRRQLLLPGTTPWTQPSNLQRGVALIWFMYIRFALDRANPTHPTMLF